MTKDEEALKMALEALGDIARARSSGFGIDYAEGYATTTIKQLRKAIAELDMPIDRGNWSGVPDATKWVDELRGDEKSESTQAQELFGKTEQLEAEIKRLQELADYRLKLLVKVQSEWVSLTDEEILDMIFDAKITEPNDEPIKFGAPSRKCIQDLVSCVGAKLKEKNHA